MPRPAAGGGSIHPDVVNLQSPVKGNTVQHVPCAQTKPRGGQQVAGCPVQRKVLPRLAPQRQSGRQHGMHQHMEPAIGQQLHAPVKPCLALHCARQVMPLHYPVPQDAVEKAARRHARQQAGLFEFRAPGERGRFGGKWHHKACRG